MEALEDQYRANASKGFATAPGHKAESASEATAVISASGKTPACLGERELWKCWY